MEGDLSLVSVPDLLQMICLGGYNRDIHLFDGPTQLGVIAIRNGRVDRCFGFGVWGEAAFYKLVVLRRGRYKVNESQDVSAASDVSLTAHSWQELLMEAARLEDEAELASRAAATGRVIAFPSPPAAFELSGLMFNEPTRESARVPAPMPSGPTAMPSGPTAMPSGPTAMPSGPIVVPSSPTAKSSNPLIGPPSRPTPFPSLFDGPHTGGSFESGPLRGGSSAPKPSGGAPKSSSGAPKPSSGAPKPPSASAPSSGTVQQVIDERASGGMSAPHPDIAELLAEATTYYLRRDMAKAEEILQKCLALRPDDKRVLQNLERIRRKKSP
jgi:hypothetical protein